MDKKKQKESGDSIAGHELNIIFMIDNSGSMCGKKIGAVNRAIREFISTLHKSEEKIPNTEIKISVMAFNDETKWAYTEPKNVADFKWRNISTAGGSDFSAAYDELARYLCTKEKGGQMPESEAPAPIIILITDGMPTSPDWKTRLAALKKKGWFTIQSWSEPKAMDTK